jgi:hypothetical protein
VETEKKKLIFRSPEYFDVCLYFFILLHSVAQGQSQPYLTFNINPAKGRQVVEWRRRVGNRKYIFMPS